MIDTQVDDGKVMLGWLHKWMCMFDFIHVMFAFLGASRGIYAFLCFDV